MDPPQGREIKIYGRARVLEEEETQITDKINIKCPQQLMYLIKNVEIEDKEILQDAVAVEQITLVSWDEALRSKGGAKCTM